MELKENDHDDIQIFVSAKSLEDELIDFDKILCASILTRSRLGLYT